MTANTFVSSFLPCRLCMKSFKNQSTLSAHFSKHFAVDHAYTCSNCNEQFACVEDLQAHTSLTGHLAVKRQPTDTFGHEFATLLSVAGQYNDDKHLLQIFRRALNSAPSYPPAVIDEAPPVAMPNEPMLVLTPTTQEASASEHESASLFFSKRRCNSAHRRRVEHPTFRSTGVYKCKRCSFFDSRWLGSLQRHVRNVHKKQNSRENVDYVVLDDDLPAASAQAAEVAAPRPATKAAVARPMERSVPVAVTKPLPGTVMSMRTRKNARATAETGAQCRLCAKSVVKSCKSKHGWVHVAAEGHRVNVCVYCGLSGAHLLSHLMRVHKVVKTIQGVHYKSYKHELQPVFEDMMRRCFNTVA